MIAVDPGRTPDPALHGGLIRVIAEKMYEALNREIPLEDIEQEICLHILKRRNSYDPAKARFSTWLMQCRTAIYRNLQRTILGTIGQGKDGFRMPPKSERLVHQEPKPDRAIVLNLPSELSAAMEQLPPHQRSILTRRAGGETFDEIARTINLSKERVRQIETKGLRRLAELMGEDPDLVGALSGVARRKKN